MAIHIKWNRRAVHQLDEAIFYIDTDSLAAAEKVKTDILLKIEELKKHPERYEPDKYKTGNYGSFRAFEIHRYRVSYRYTE